MVPEKRNIDTKQTADILKYTYYFERVRKTLLSGNSSPGRLHKGRTQNHNSHQNQSNNDQLTWLPDFKHYSRYQRGIYSPGLSRFVTAGAAEVSTILSLKIKARFFRLFHDVVTCDVDRDVSTTYC